VTGLNAESLRIADQLRRALSGDAWHGPSLRELLADVRAEQAAARPLPSGHTIWELVLHIDAYMRGALEAAGGGVMPKIYGTEKDWAPIADFSAAAWAEARDQLLQGGERLAHGIEGFADSRLKDTVPGRDYDFYYLFHGVVQHGLFHGGQIAMLKRAA
jgi:hypothetical protein